VFVADEAAIDRTAAYVVEPAKESRPEGLPERSEPAIAVTKGSLLPQRLVWSLPDLVDNDVKRGFQPSGSAIDFGAPISAEDLSEGLPAFLGPLWQKVRNVPYPDVSDSSLGLRTAEVTLLGYEAIEQVTEFWEASSGSRGVAGQWLSMLAGKVLDKMENSEPTRLAYINLASH
ncbi:MAG: hypothetical protein ACREHG_04355, partial [Candidatus Saccharimonadales bacterium]